MREAIFIINSILLGVGLAMDAFSVSLVDGMLEPRMRQSQKMRIAGVFAVFQFMMPMIGWFCVRKLVEYFAGFQVLVPWIALFLLLYIGGKMLWEAKQSAGEEHTQQEAEVRNEHTGNGTLAVQGIATSIDALSVGFTIEAYGLARAGLCSLIIGAVTYVICRLGIRLGIRFGTRIAGRAQVLGGLILIGIGLEIFIKNMFFGG